MTNKQYDQLIGYFGRQWQRTKRITYWHKALEAMRAKPANMTDDQLNELAYMYHTRRQRLQKKKPKKRYQLPHYSAHYTLFSHLIVFKQ